MGLNVNKYLNNLPDEVLVDAEFCVTLVGAKQPYDPFKKESISAKDPFYSIEDILSIEETSLYDTIGLKVGNGISAIDIDNCVGANGNLSEVAIDIINFMKSYTELSPSGSGIRILFKATNEYDFNIYKTKDSINEVEYYDADYQESKGARMVRLTGDKIMNYEFREVDTAYVLEKYMKRKFVAGESLLVEKEVDERWVDLVYVLVAIRTDLKNIFNREVKLRYESESDLIICNVIAEYTNNPNEIMAVFKKLRYYKTKGIKSDKKNHKQKWNGAYGWDTVNLSMAKEIRLVYYKEEELESTNEEKIVVAYRHNLLKQYHFKHLDIDWDLEVSSRKEVSILYKLITMRMKKHSIVKLLGGK